MPALKYQGLLAIAILTLSPLAAQADPAADVDPTAMPQGMALPVNSTKPQPTAKPAAPAPAIAPSQAPAAPPTNPYADLPDIKVKPVGGITDTPPSATPPPPTSDDSAPRATAKMRPSPPSAAMVRRANDEELFGQLNPDDDAARSNVIVKPGVNQLVDIARDHLNRISTPFGTPSVKTTSNADIEARQSVLYIAPHDDRPIVLYITEKDQEDPAIAITLMPRHIPPRPISLRFDDYMPLQSYENKDAEKWETDLPFVQMIKTLMRKVAMGDIPPGFRLRARNYHDPAVLCADPALRVDPQQVLEGARLIVSIATVKNISSQNIEIEESSCYMPGVTAVAAWPSPFLTPGQQSELYVIDQRDSIHDQPKHKRPSLINEYRAELP
ncbi:MAG: hypothetical protein E6Q76_07480 [Rhizobium sp.]|nr:MAG: hypothetical protein E6Q76_07480 [Rhizobium sp.]